MSTIDEIMGAIGRHGDDCIRCADAASKSFELLRDLIAAALADARRDGAEVMREACEKAVWLTRLESGLPDSDDKGVSGWIEVAEDRVRRSPIPMPMPTGERQAALLTDGQVAARIAQHWGSVDIAPQSVHGFARSIESAVIAANTLEVRRG